MEDDDEYDGIDIHDRAVVFVYDDNDTPADYDDNSADVLTGAELKRASLPAGDNFELVGTKDPYLTAKDAGFNYVFCMSVGADLNNLTTIGGNYGYLLAKAWETRDEDGTYYRVFDLWTDSGRKTAYEETGDTYKYPSGTVIRYEVLSTDGDNIYIRSVENADPIQGKVEARDGNFVGIDGQKYELVNDSVVMNVDTVDKEGISYGDEARADIPLADTTEAGKVNALYIVADNDEISFLLIDTANIEIVDDYNLTRPDATALSDALADAGEVATAASPITVTVAGTVPAGRFTVPANVVLELADDVVVTGNTVINGRGSVELKGDLALNGMLTVRTNPAMTSKATSIDASGFTRITAAQIATLFTYTDDLTVGALPSGVAIGATQTLTISEKVDATAVQSLVPSVGATLVLSEATDGNYDTTTPSAIDFSENDAHLSSSDPIPGGTYVWTEGAIVEAPNSYPAFDKQ